jgi:type IV secretion system protein VirB9
MRRRACPFSLGLVALAIASVCGATAQAQRLDVPISGPVDPRVRTVLFKEDTVVALRGHYGYQMTVEFGADERIENVSVGDSLAWQVTPNRRADTRYTFQLSAEAPSGPGDPNIIYRVKFTFLPDAPAPATEVVAKSEVTQNRAYSVSGSVRNMPTQIYDDGTLTYFEWPAGAATPAVFALSGEGQEAVVNFVMRGPLMVVERVGPAFILRNGPDETRVINDGWREPSTAPLSPQAVAPPQRTEPPRRSWFGTRTKPKATP